MPPEPVRVASARREASPRRFFIVGSPRSGTTLLRVMLDAHPALAVPPETHFGLRYVRQAGRFGRAEAARTREAVLDAFCASEVFAALAIDEAAYRRAARRLPDDPWHPLRVALDAYGRRRGASIVGEKTPSHALQLPALAEAFPEARFLLVHRDPRAVVASWLDASWSRHAPRDIAETWRRHAEAMRGAERSLSGRCLRVGFAELVADTPVVLASVCAFLGVEPDASMGRYPERARGASPGPAGEDEALTFEPPRPARIDAWRRALPAATRRRIEAICAGAMRDWGYACDSPPVVRLGAALTALPPLWRKRLKRGLRARREARERLSPAPADRCGPGSPGSATARC